MSMQLKTIPLLLVIGLLASNQCNVYASEGEVWKTVERHTVVRFTPLQFAWQTGSDGFEGYPWGGALAHDYQALRLSLGTRRLSVSLGGLRDVTQMNIGGSDCHARIQSFLPVGLSVKLLWTDLDYYGDTMERGNLKSAFGGVELFADGLLWNKWQWSDSWTRGSDGSALRGTIVNFGIRGYFSLLHVIGAELEVGHSQVLQPQMSFNQHYIRSWLNPPDTIVTGPFDLDIGGPYFRIALTADIAYRKRSVKRVPIYNPPKLPPRLSVSATYEDSDGDAILQAGERGWIRGAISNTGDGKATQVTLAAITSDRKGLVIPSTISLGDIKPGANREFSFELGAQSDLPTGAARFTVTARDMFDHHTEKSLDIATLAFQAPKLELASTVIDDDQFGQSRGNGNNRIEPGEYIEASSTIRNTGVGPAEDVNVRLEYNPAWLRVSGKNMFSLGDVDPGEERDVQYVFSVDPQYSDSGVIPLTLVASESLYKFGFQTSCDLRLYQSSSQQQAPATGVADDVDVQIPSAARKNPDAIAVVISIYSYNSKDIPKVPYALRDASIMKEYLINTLGYEPHNILDVQNPTKAALEALFGTDKDARGRIYSMINPGRSELFVYYSGHGAPDLNSRQSYLIPSDCDPALVGITGYPLSTLYGNLGLLATRQTWVVMDACFSGGYNEGTLIPGASPISVELTGSEQLLKNGTVFASAEADQIASWYPEKRHGLFTYMFLKGLQGSADTNGNGSITVGEMQRYLSSYSSGVPFYARQLWQRDQTPVVVSRNLDDILVTFK